MKQHNFIAAPHTPFLENGEVNLSEIANLYAFLKRNGIKGVFVNGSTSEGYQMTTEERMKTAEAWDAAVDPDFQLFIFVGHLSTKEACNLAAHANGLKNVKAVSATGPFYQRPGSLELLVDICQTIAAAAPDKGFYYYHIPVLTNISFSMTDFLKAAAPRIPNLKGVKYTHTDMQDYITATASPFPVMAGVDEIALASMQLGADWFIGSTYNFMLPLYIQMGKCLEAGDIEGALNLQRKSIEIIGILAKNGYMPAAKFVMSHLGVNVGIARHPFKNLTDEQKAGILKDLTAAGFFEYANK